MFKEELTSMDLMQKFLLPTLKEFDLANKVAILGKDQGWIKEYTLSLIHI